MLPAKSNQDLSTPPPICWHVWSRQTCSSSCAPGRKKRFTSPPALVLESKANLGQRVPLLWRGGDVGSSSMPTWSSEKSCCTAQLCCLHPKQRDAAALTSAVQPGGPSPAFLPCVVLSAFPQLQGQRLSLIFCPLRLPGAAAGSPAAKHSKSRRREAASRLHGEGSKCGVT